MTSKLDNEQLNLRLDKIERLVIEVGKQYSSIQNTLDLIYGDRDLLTDIGEQLSSVRGLVLSADKHNEALTKDVKQEVQIKSDQVMVTVEEKTDEVKKKLIQKVPEQIFNNIQSLFKKTPTGKKLEKRSRFKQVLYFFRFWNRVPYLKGGE